MKSKKKEKLTKDITAFRQSVEGRRLLDQMAEQENMDRSQFIRRLIHDEAWRRELEIPEVVKIEST